jgi:SAM-dependent methyltransferase
MKSENRTRNHYNNKTTNNDFEALDYLIDGKPITYEYYKQMIITPTLRNLHLESDDKVLDVGCGTGLIMKEIENDVKYIEGIDISQNLLNFYKGKANVSCSSVLDFDYKQNFYTKIYMVSVGIHFEDLAYFKTAVRKLLSALAPGGTLLIGDQLIADFYTSKKYFSLYLNDLINFLNELGYHFSLKTQAAEFRNRNRYDILIYK